MDNLSIPEIVKRLGSDEESSRKMAVFRLQSAIGDPSFADVFIVEGGLPKLAYLTLHSTGNTLAYALTSFSRLLELDKGWEAVSDALTERIVELVVGQPLVNVNRGAMSVLAAIVSHPHRRESQPDQSGFQRVKPAIDAQPHFLPMLVKKITSADHALCANSLQLINALMRDAISSGPEAQWPKFIKQLRELGVIKSVYGLMQSTAVQDLAHPLLEFQSLTKLLVRKWKDERVDAENPDHRRTMRGLHIASSGSSARTSVDSRETRASSSHTERWRRLGFQTSAPASEFGAVGFLGLIDLTEYVFKNEEGFQNLLLEQEAQLEARRCPIARASVATTAILYEHFEVEKSDGADPRFTMLEARQNVDRAFRPLLLHWPRLHSSALTAFMRLWKATGATHDDFDKVEELVRILVEQVIGQAPRTKDVKDVEDEMGDFDCRRLRELQMELISLAYEDDWGHHLRQVREELNHEALQFVKEQRIRCLLDGAWFPHAFAMDEDPGPITKQSVNRLASPSRWRFVRLSHNRRFLHYADFDARPDATAGAGADPKLDALPEKIDLFIVSSVVSNVSAGGADSSSTTTTANTNNNTNTTAAAANTAASTAEPTPRASTATTKITIHGYDASSADPSRERPLLQLHPPTHAAASEWLDGLLMLLNQQPITADTHRLTRLIGEYGLKIRLLNVRFEDGGGDEPPVPPRDGLDDDYYYEISGMEAAGGSEGVAAR